MLLLTPGFLSERAPQDLKALLRRTHGTSLPNSLRSGGVSGAGLAPSIFRAHDLDQ